MKRKQARKPIEAKKYTWGYIFAGSKDALIKAGLASAKNFRRGWKNGKEYQLLCADGVRRVAYVNQETCGPKYPEIWVSFAHAIDYALVKPMLPGMISILGANRDHAEEVDSDCPTL